MQVHFMKECVCLTNKLLYLDFKSHWHFFSSFSFIFWQIINEYTILLTRNKSNSILKFTYNFNLKWNTYNIIYISINKYHNNFRFRRKKCCQLYNYLHMYMCTINMGNTDKWHRCPVMLFYFMFFTRFARSLAPKILI